MDPSSGPGGEAPEGPPRDDRADVVDRRSGRCPPSRPIHDSLSALERLTHLKLQGGVLMELSRIDVRFFRSFNFDYERKAHPKGQPAAWEDQDPWHPFVRVPIESDITAVVGSNEAGKSQLLIAVKAAFTGQPIDRADFCRYSDRYSVRSGELRLPEFGAVFTLTADEAETPPITALRGRREFGLYRPGSAAAFLVIDQERVQLLPADLSALTAALPAIFDISTDVAIPDTVSIAELAGEPRRPLHRRRTRARLLRTLFDLAPGSDAASTGTAVLPILTDGEGVDDAHAAAERRREREFELAKKLLITAAGIDQGSFKELRDAVAEENEGQIEAVIKGMNTAIKENLNIQRWWSQDRDFELRVEAREHELAFTIEDRTKSRYSFKERSQGLRYFLSYFVQLLAHRLEGRRTDLLLLDEPDAYLSSTGQQDLLRLLHDYAHPEDGGLGGQVVYVTHSPFLVDRNAPHRIRVLDKGAEDEGTRVVRDAANNRYEPLRSSLGQYVAETAFIGGKNLFVEGVADQVLLAGTTAHLARTRGSQQDVLNLNEITVVASGGADGIPYLVYLARGRDTIKPPCVVLLDGDTAGLQAEKVLQRGDQRKKRILEDRFIVRLDLWAAGSGLSFDEHVTVNEIEDLIPVPLLRRAAVNYLARFQDLSEVSRLNEFTIEAIAGAVRKADGSTWDGVAAVYTAMFEGEHLDKVGLAREVVQLLATTPDADGIATLLTRFAALLTVLREALEDADLEEQERRADSRLDRAVRAFEADYSRGVAKTDALRVLKQIDAALGDSEFADQHRIQIAGIIRDFELHDRAHPTVPRFPNFKDAVRALRSNERLAYQDDAQQDPSASHPPQPLRTAAPVPAPELRPAATPTW